MSEVEWVKTSKIQYQRLQEYLTSKIPINMDPQKLSSLDPKLREAYQRVMGTPVPQPQTAPVHTQTSPPAGGPLQMPTPNPSPPTPEPQPEFPPAGGPTPPIPEFQPSFPQTEPTPTSESAMPQQPPVQTANFVQMNSEVAAAPSSPNFSAPAPQAQTTVVKKKNHLMPILIGLGAVVFLMVYALFWTKIFNFKLPF